MEKLRVWKLVRRYRARASESVRGGAARPARVLLGFVGGPRRTGGDYMRAIVAVRANVTAAVRARRGASAAVVQEACLGGLRAR